MSQTTKSKFAYTKSHHFRSRFNEYETKSNIITNSDTKIISPELKNKLINQFEQFSNKYKEIASKYDINNFISFGYIQNILIELNDKYENFTQITVEISIDLEKTKLLEEGLKNKDFLLLGALFSKQTMMEFLFNETCIKLGWFVVTNDI